MDYLEALRKQLADYILSNEANRLPGGAIIYEPALVGCAAADDPVFESFRQEEVIGPFYRLPGSWLAEAGTVISYFLPFSNIVRETNYRGESPSLEWLHARFLGEKFNNSLRRYLVAALETEGHKAVAPLLEEGYAQDYTLFISNWSERHAAYAAGLGSFGLHRGLITPRGVAGRFGSVITDLKLVPTPRPSTSHTANCPFLEQEQCGECIARCPSGAISPEGKDKGTCYALIREKNIGRETLDRFGYPHSACGKCQVDVPCEKGIPM